MTRGPSKNCGVCQSTFGNSDCYHFEGNGSLDRPYRPVSVFAPDAGNLLESGPAGDGAFVPSWLLNPPACHVYGKIDEDLVIPFDLGFPLIFHLVRYDTDSMYDEEAPERITFKTPGIYRCALNIRWNRIDTLDQGDQAAFIRKNRSTFLNLDSMSIGGPDLFGSQSLAVEEPFEAGEFIDAFVKQDAVAGPEETDLQITTTRSSPNFTATFLRPLPE